MAELKEIINQIELVRNILSVRSNIYEIPSIEYDIVMEKLRNIYEQLLQRDYEPKTEIEESSMLEEIPTPIIPVTSEQNDIIDTEPEIEIEVEVGVADDESEDIIELESEPEMEIELPELTLEPISETELESEPEIEPEIENQEINPLFDDIDTEIIDRIYGESAPTKSAETIETQTSTIKCATPIFTPSETTTLSDQFQNNSEVLNETLGNNTQRNLATKLSSGYSDLRSQIGINDRFMFIRELFNNDENLYEHTISYLNNQNDLNDILIYLSDNFRWKGDNAAVQSFMNILMKKLS